MKPAKQLSLVVALIAGLSMTLAGGMAYADADLAGVIAVNEAGAEAAPVVVLSLDGFELTFADVDGQFFFNEVEDGLVILFSLLFISEQEPVVVDGSLFRDGEPALLTLVMLFQGGQPHIAFVGFDGTYTIPDLGSGLSFITMISLLL